MSLRNIDDHLQVYPMSQSREPVSRSTAHGGVMLRNVFCSATTNQNDVSLNIRIFACISHLHFFTTAISFSYVIQFYLSLGEGMDDEETK
jgi:hypothetical protein